MVKVRVAGALLWLRRVSRRLCQNTKVRRLLVSPYTIPVAVFCSYVVLNLGIGGPAYLSDEIAYLDKAATVAGSVVHASTSWFGGYSFMISPAFLISGNPHIEWNTILALNALMWALTALLLQYILRRTYPEVSLTAVRLTTLGAMLYPSWLSMSGYAFSTSGFVLVFMASLAALIKSKLMVNRWLYLSGMLAAYLCWIHPLGVLFLGLLVVLFAAQGILQKQRRFLLASLCSVIFALSYLMAVRPLLNYVMRGSAVNDSHYAQGLSVVLQATTDIHAWLQAGELLIGLVFFAVVATFGLAVYSALPIIRELYSKRHVWKEAAQDERLVAMGLSLLIVIIVIICTAVSTAMVDQPRIDQWVYGRYTDMYLLPLLAFGLLAIWRAKQTAVLAAFALIAGAFLSVITNPGNTAFGFNNKVNIQGLWPMQIASVVHANDYWVWGLVGAVGVALTAYMGSAQRKRWLMLLLVPVVLAGAGNYLYHRTIVRQAATVSSLYQYLRDNYSPTDCMGFTLGPDGPDRFSLYSYYLHGYNLSKISQQQWEQERCQGPYLTYDLSAVSAANLQIIGQEISTGLYVVAPPSEVVAVSPVHGNAPSVLGVTYHQPIIFK